MSFSPVENGPVPRDGTQIALSKTVISIMDKRSELRLEKQLLVNIDKTGFESMGLTSNISKNGMLITTTEVLPLNCEVSILLGVADETFALKGQVIWSREWNGGSSSSHDTRAAAGIKILEAPGQYIKYVEEILSHCN